MANTHAKCGAASHIAPRHLILPQKRKKSANAKFNTKNTHEIPAPAFDVITAAATASASKRTTSAAEVRVEFHVLSISMKLKIDESSISKMNLN